MNTNKLTLPRIAAGALALVFALGSIAPVHAGAVGGPKVARGEYVSAKTRDVYTVRFRGGERASIGANGTGDIDIYVYDEDGDLVTSDNDDDFTPRVSWVPSYTQTYTVKVVNTEYHGVTYNFATN